MSYFDRKLQSAIKYVCVWVLETRKVLQRYTQNDSHYTRVIHLNQDVVKCSLMTLMTSERSQKFDYSNLSDAIESRAMAWHCVSSY